MIYFCWVGEPQLQIYQGVFILSIAKAFFPLAEPVVVLRKESIPRALRGECYKKCYVRAAEEYGLGYDLEAGANIAGFEKVCNAMIAQGIY